MKNITVSLFFTLLLSIVVIYILHPLNYGAVALVVLLCAGLVALVRMLLKSRNKKTGE